MPVVAPRPRAATLGAPRPGRPSRVARPARRPAPRSSASAEPATEESDPAAPPPTPPSGAAEDSTPSVARAKLNAGIAGFYDASTGLWEDIWGDHLHHGYYPTDGSPQPRSNREAQVEMVERVVGWAGVGRAADGSGAPLPVRRALDVGCGLGGSARHLAAALGCAAEGVTLSPVQAARGNELSAAAGLGDRVALRVADALALPFPAAAFDLVWSLESGEHMPDKAAFVAELARVSAPGGRVVVVTWCHRELAPGEAALRPDERALLDAICAAYYLPAWCAASEYERLFAAEGLTGVRTADWSAEVAPFWGAVIRSALTPRGLLGLLKAGWETARGAAVMPLMATGLKRGTIRFALVTGVKAGARE